MVPRSHIVLLTDALSHNLDLVSNVTKEANDRQVCISFFLSLHTTPCLNKNDLMVYENISAETGGTVAYNISMDGFREFQASHEYTQCGDFYHLPPIAERTKRQVPVPPSYSTYGTEKSCHSFETSQFTATFKVTARTNQHDMTVTKPTGESESVSSLYGSSGPVYSESSPPSGVWRVCVNTGTLSITLEKNDVMDNILKYLRPVVNSTQFFTKSNPPPACKLLCQV